MSANPISNAIQKQLEINEATEKLFRTMLERIELLERQILTMDSTLVVFNAALDDLMSQLRRYETLDALPTDGLAH